MYVRHLYCVVPCVLHPTIFLNVKKLELHSDIEPHRNQKSPADFYQFDFILLIDILFLIIRPVDTRRSNTVGKHEVTGWPISHHDLLGTIVDITPNYNYQLYVNNTLSLSPRNIRLTIICSTN